MIRLVPETNYYVTSNSEILFIESCKKILASRAEQYLYNRGTIAAKKGTLKDSSGFSVKIEKNTIYVSNPNILKGRWLKLANQDKDNILAISEFCEVNKGQVVGKDFDLAFKTDTAGQRLSETSWMVTKEMNDIYLEAWREFTRRMNFMFKKKTKGYKSGHRYDSEYRTLWYVGEIKTPVFNPSDPSVVTTVTRHGFVNRPVGTTVKETLESVKCLEIKPKIGDIDPSSIEDGQKTTLYLIETSPLMSDSGQELNPEPVIEPYEVWESWIDGTKFEKSRVNCWEDDCPDTIHLFELLYLITNTSSDGLPEYLTLADQDVKDRIKQKLTKILESYVRYNIIVPYMGRDIYNKELRLKKSDAFDVQVKTINSLVVYEMPCSKKESEHYIRTLGYLGISLTDVIRKALTWYNTNFSMDDFERYYKYQKCLSNDKSTTKGLSLQRSTSDNGLLRSNFKHQEIADAIIDMVKMADEDLGLADSFFNYLGVFQYSRRSTPTISLKIDLIDLVNWFGGVDKMSTTLKEKIIDEKFNEISISFTRGTEFV